MKTNPADYDFVAVASILDNHRGRASAVTQKELAVQAYLFDRTGRPDVRRVQQILQIRKDAFPFIVVGSDRGMYVAVDPEDLNHEINSRLSRIKNIAVGIRTLKRKALARGWKFENGRFVEAPMQQELFHNGG